METKKEITSGLVFGTLIHIMLLSSCIYYLIHDVDTVLEAVAVAIMLIVTLLSARFTYREVRHAIQHRRNQPTTK